MTSTTNIFRAVTKWISSLGCLIALLAITVLGGCKKTPEPDLIIASPHSDLVQQEFEYAFEKYCKDKLGRDIQIQWRNIGGTTEITRYITAQYEAADSCGVDIYFGGGAPDHKMLASLGVLDAVALPEEILAQIPQTLGGVLQRDRENRWFGACISSFGILYNNKLAEQLSVPAPAGWDDLASLPMLDKVCTAGPKSGSARASYEMMLQSAPDWPSGWARLLKFWANCKTFTQGASDVPSLVANGEVIAGTCIDYYAFNAITKSGSDSLKYCLPAGGSAFTPDPISMLKGAPNRELGVEFIKFVLSAEGQALWCLPRGTDGGPQFGNLYRQPIRRDSYTMYDGKMLSELKNAYKLAGGFELDEQMQSLRITFILPHLMKAAAIDNSELLSKAWRKIIADGNSPEQIAVFTKLPESIDTREKLLDIAKKIAEFSKSGDDKEVERIVSVWREHFYNSYNKILSE